MLRSLAWVLIVVLALPATALAYGQASYYTQGGYYTAAFTGSTTETSPTYYAFQYGGCAGAGYDTYVTRTRDINNDYSYNLYVKWRADYSGWHDEGVTTGITNTATMGGHNGRDTVYVKLIVDLASPHRAGASIVISSCKGDLTLPSSGDSHHVAGASQQIFFPAIAPTCSVTVDTSPIAYGGSTILRWTSANANFSFYINNVGYVTPNASGSTTVGPLVTTNYDGAAVGSAGGVPCARTLVVGSASGPTCTFVATPNTIDPGGSSTLTWTSTNATAASIDHGIGSVAPQNTH